MENLIQNLVIENKSKISVNSVLEVLAFSDKEIRLKLKDNTQLYILGLNLKINCFDNKNLSFLASGSIEGVRYKGAQENLLKKVFK